MGRANARRGTLLFDPRFAACAALAMGRAQGCTLNTGVRDEHPTGRPGWAQAG